MNSLLRTDVVIVYYSHLWARRSSCYLRTWVSNPLQRFRVCSYRLGYYRDALFASNRLTAQRDPNFILIFVPSLLGEVLLAVGQRLCFQHDGALGRTLWESVRQWLKATCLGRWLGYAVEVEDTVYLFGGWI
jgi:hypothetical protein